MKANILNKKGENKGNVDLPKQFSEKFHPNLIKRAFNSNMSFNYQHHGTNPLAGKRHVIEVRKRRNVYRSGYGRGKSRVPKKIIARRGNRLNFIAEQAPHVRKGRTAHPPLVDKIFEEKINKKEKLFAIRSAISATVIKDLVEKRNHKIGSVKVPLVVEGIEYLNKTSQVKDLLMNLGLKNELDRIKIKKQRPGVGKMRGRRYKLKKGPLFVTSKNCELIKSAKSMQGIEAIDVSNLNVTLLAPGGVSGRLTIWTKEAIDVLEEKKLFLGDKK